MHACLGLIARLDCEHKALQNVTCYACTTTSHALTRTALPHRVATCLQANAMADDFTMAEDGGAKTYSKQGE